LGQIFRKYQGPRKISVHKKSLIIIFHLLRAVLSLLSDADEDVRLLLNAPDNANYLSPQIQNEMITILGNTVLKKVVEEINQSLCITLMADETGTHAREYLSICIRHLSEEIKVSSLIIFVLLSIF
jgi:hypothetical protein